MIEDGISETAADIAEAFDFANLGERAFEASVKFEDAMDRIIAARASVARQALRD